MDYTPHMDVLVSLNSWPEGTVGYNQENQLIAILLALCVEHGFGRVPQITAQIEDIWRNPEKVEEYFRIRNKRLQLLEEDKEWLSNYETMKKHLLAYIVVLGVESVIGQLTDEEAMIAGENQMGCLIFLCDSLDKLADKDEEAAKLRDLIRERQQVSHVRDVDDPKLVEITQRCAEACITYYQA